MIQLVNKNDCSGCGACRQICPAECITMRPDKEGFFYPETDTSRCIHCNLCNKVCPMTHSKRRDPANERVYACKNKDHETRIKSSSGGIFSLLAKQIIDTEGVVFGAAAEGKKIIHKYAETQEELIAFRGSKYVQSDTLSCFKQAKSFLEKKRPVLFSGTPCQIYGLSLFLGKEYDNLFLIDCICLGVPSPKVWEKYVSFLETNSGAPLNEISFRDKSTGWKNYSLSIKFNNGEEYHSSHYKDPYLKGFSKCLFLRPSCHDCRFKDLHSRADITLGDYWGVDTKFPNFDDNKGVSLILTNTPKGEKLFENISDDLEYLSSDLKHAAKTHRSMISSIEPNKQRNAFFEELDKTEILPLLQKYTKPTAKELFKEYLKKALRKT